MAIFNLLARSWCRLGGERTGVDAAGAVQRGVGQAWPPRPGAGLVFHLSPAMSSSQPPPLSTRPAIAIRVLGWTGAVFISALRAGLSAEPLAALASSHQLSRPLRPGA